MKSCLVSQQRQEEQLSASIPRHHKQDNHSPTMFRGEHSQPWTRAAMSLP